MAAVLSNETVTEKRSFCRICTGICGTIVTLDANDRMTAVRGDDEDPQTLGFICSKGAAAADAHNSHERILQPLKRMPNGEFVPIPLEQALSEIAAKLKVILDRDGPEAIAAYRGSGGFFASICLAMLPAWMEAIGSPKLFSTLTIDQSAKVVTAGRLGFWEAGPQRFQSNDVQLLFGSNPLVSIAHLDTRNPLKRLKDAKARGMKLIVIDPRRTETAKYADLLIQPLPGNDALIAGAMLKIILDEGWHDVAFCEQHVGDLAQLRAAVEPFTETLVEQRADIAPGLLRQAAQLFSRPGARGTAGTGTGPDMSPFSNLTEHLVQCLNVVCGRFLREGEEVGNSGFLIGHGPRRAQVIPAMRPWEQGPKSRIGGFGQIGGEMVTAVLADEILEPGNGQVKFFLNHGGNPAQAIPDQRKLVKALRSLELMVSIEPYMTPSAAVSHYILPPKLPYERADLPIYIFESIFYPTPYTRYTPKVAESPPGSEVCDEWYVLWSLAQRLGKPMKYMGVPLDMQTPPTEDYLLALTAKDAPASYEDIKQEPLGYFLDVEQYALPPDPAVAGKFSTAPCDVQDEIRALLQAANAVQPQRFAFRLASRRNRHRFNSFGFAAQPTLKRLMPYNHAYMNPADLATLAIKPGDWLKIESDNGAITVLAEADDTVRTGVVSISHGFGGLPDEDDFLEDGASPNLLISTDRDLQTINAMPRMSGIPVNVFRVTAPA
jgi:anaerobic selenocysteine-containing dehydrogenase